MVKDDAIPLREDGVIGDVEKPAKDVEAGVTESNSYRERFLTESVAMLKLALPIAVTFLMQMGYGIVGVLTVGHLGVEWLDGVALGNVIMNVTGVSVILGISMAMDTLAPQAYGAQNYELVSIILQRTSVIALIMCVPVIILWWNMEPILLRLGQDPRISELAAWYLKLVIPLLPSNVLLEVMKKYLQAMSIAAPVTAITFAGFIFNAILTYVLVWALGWGFPGAPVALSATYVLMLILTLLYILFARQLLGSKWVPADPRDCWYGFSREAFNDWIPFFKLGIPSCAQLCLEWWAFEILALESGILGQWQLACTNITTQLVLVCFVWPLGACIAAATRVGQELGAGRPEGAKMAAWVAVSIIAAVGILLGVAMILMRKYWALAFTEDEHVIATTSRLLLMISVFQLFDSLQACMGGVLRGAGLQLRGAAITLVCQWLIGIPLGAVATFVWGWGLYGLWGGCGIGLIIMAGLQILVLCRLDWHNIADEATKRSKKMSQSTVDLVIQDDDGQETLEGA